MTATPPTDDHAEEFAAMSTAWSILSSLPRETRNRVVNWLNSRNATENRAETQGWIEEVTA